MKIIKTSDCLPAPDTDVLALFKERQIELDGEPWPRNPYCYIVAKIKFQHLTGKPLWLNAWTDEVLDAPGFAAVGWWELPANE